VGGVPSCFFSLALFNISFIWLVCISGFINCCIFRLLFIFLIFDNITKNHLDKKKTLLLKNFPDARKMTTSRLSSLSDELRNLFLFSNLLEIFSDIQRFSMFINQFSLILLNSLLRQLWRAAFRISKLLYL